MTVLERLVGKLEHKKSVLVLPEGGEGRVLRAARILRDRNLARIVLLSSLSNIEGAAAMAGSPSINRSSAVIGDR